MHYAEQVGMSHPRANVELSRTYTKGTLKGPGTGFICGDEHAAG